MTIKYDEIVNDIAQEEYIKIWNEKRRLKKNKRKEKFNKIKELLGGKR